MLQIFSKITFLFFWMLFSTFAAALSVGDAQVRSTLGQPLQVTIPVSLDSPEEMESAENLRVSLLPGGNSDAHGGQAGFPPGFLQVSVRSSVEGRLLLLTSRQPFLEPVSTLQLRVSLGSISIIREVSLLLDPPMFDKARTTIATREAPTPNVAPTFSAASSAEALSAVALSTAVATPDKVPAVLAKAATETKPQRQKAPRPQKPEIKTAVAPEVASAPPAPQGVERFKLDFNFASYSLLKAQGLVPQTVTAVAVQPPPTLPTSTVIGGGLAHAGSAPDSAMEATPAPDSGPGASLTRWLVVLAAIAGLAFVYRRSEQLKRAIRLLWVKLARKARKRRASAARKALPARPFVKANEEDNERSTHDDFVDGVAMPAPTPVIAPAANEVIGLDSPTSEVDFNHIRKRIQEISKRPLAADARSRLTIAEAHLDLRRMSAATRLLDELESSYEAPKQPILLRG